MGENTKIEWATHTFNGWYGCSEVGPACDFCYARVMMQDRYGKVRWGAGEDRIRTSAAYWREPLRWNRVAQAEGTRPTVFCLSLGDIWDNEVDPLWRRQLFELIEKTPNLIWLLLSKRIGNAVKMCDPMAGNSCLPTNAAVGATMVTQEEWDRDAPKLEEARDRLGAMFSFASIEPMLGPIDARNHMPNWVICGGESGAHARPMHPDWARSLRDQCAAADVPYFFKQWGEFGEAKKRRGGYAVADRTTTVLNIDGSARPYRPDGWEPQSPNDPTALMERYGKKAAGRLLDGRTHDEMPNANT